MKKKYRMKNCDAIKLTDAHNGVTTKQLIDENPRQVRGHVNSGILLDSAAIEYLETIEQETGLSNEYRRSREHNLAILSEFNFENRIRGASHSMPSDGAASDTLEQGAEDFIDRYDGSWASE